MKKTTLLLLLLSLVTVCEAQNRYCVTYEDWLNGKSYEFQYEYGLEV